MLFMVVERFREGSLGAVAERFEKHGRLMPPGVLYHASWVEPNGERCFQVVDAMDVSTLNEWADAWRDLVDFEVVPVETSGDFWSKRRNKSMAPE